MPMHN